jgi:hypothetical protein
LGGRGRRISQFEASLVYRVSSRTARAIQRKPVSKKEKKKKRILRQRDYRFKTCLSYKKSLRPAWILGSPVSK